MAGLASSAFRFGASVWPLRDLHDVGAAVAVRHLHHAEPVAMRIEPHGLGIDRHRIRVAGQIGQVAAMQADGHEGLVSQVDSTETLAPGAAGGERVGMAYRTGNGGFVAIFRGHHRH